MARIEANGIELEVQESGDAGAPALLLINGLGQQLVRWPPAFVEGLAGEGFRVLRFDNRDTGLSTRLEAAGPPRVMEAISAVASGAPVDAPYTLADMADDAAELLAALGVARAHVVGFSLGGMIAQMVAARHPARAASLVSVMSTSSRPGLPGGRPDAVASLTSVPDDPNDRDSVIEHTVDCWRLYGGPAYGFDEEEARTRIAAAYDRAYYPAGGGRQMLAVLATGSRVPFLEKLSLPTLVIHGDADPLIPLAAGVDTAKTVPDARLEIIEGWGHDMPAGVLPRLVALIAGHARAAGGAGSPSP